MSKWAPQRKQKCLSSRETKDWSFGAWTHIFTQTVSNDDLQCHRCIEQILSQTVEVFSLGSEKSEKINQSLVNTSPFKLTSKSLFWQLSCKWGWGTDQYEGLTHIDSRKLLSFFFFLNLKPREKVSEHRMNLAGLNELMLCEESQKTVTQRLSAINTVE